MPILFLLKCGDQLLLWYVWLHFVVCKMHFKSLMALMGKFCRLFASDFETKSNNAYKQSFGAFAVPFSLAALRDKAREIWFVLSICASISVQ